MKILYCFENNKYLIKLSKDNDQIKINFEGSDLYFVMYNYHEDNKFVIGKDNDLYAYLKIYLMKLELMIIHIIKCLMIINLFG